MSCRGRHSGWLTDGHVGPQTRSTPDCHQCFCSGGQKLSLFSCARCMLACHKLKFDFTCTLAIPPVRSIFQNGLGHLVHGRDARAASQHACSRCKLFIGKASALRCLHAFDRKLNSSIVSEGKCVSSYLKAATQAVGCLANSVTSLGSPPRTYICQRALLVGVAPLGPLELHGVPQLQLVQAL